MPANPVGTPGRAWPRYWRRAHPVGDFVELLSVEGGPAQDGTGWTGDAVLRDVGSEAVYRLPVRYVVRWWRPAPPLELPPEVDT